MKHLDAYHFFDGVYEFWVQDQELISPARGRRHQSMPPVLAPRSSEMSATPKGLKRTTVSE